MSPRTTLTRLGIAAATTALSVGAVTPALASPADDDWGTSWNQQQQNSQSNPSNPSNPSANDGGGQQQQQPQGTSSWNQQGNSQQSGTSDWGQHSNNTSSSTAVLYKGIVTANGGLRLRSAPNRGSAIIRVVPKGSIVNIFCKVGGENVDGNSLWYLLTDGTWAWGAARYIDNIGAAPRFC